MEKFTYKSSYCEYPDCFFQIARYPNKNIAISIMSESEGPITRCTTNTGMKLPDDRIIVKYWSENEGMERFLMEMGIIESEPCDIDINSPMTPDVYKLTEKGLKIIREQLEEFVE